jgi:hypothetical protein
MLLEVGDDSVGRLRIRDVRNVGLVVLVLAAWLTAAVASAGDRRDARVSVGRGISVLVPRGWDLVRTEVGPSDGNRLVSLQPAVIASFAVAFARRSCPCARPNYRTCGVWCREIGIRDFPKAGALVFVWEFPSPRNRAALGRGYGPRPVRFRVAQKNPHFATALAHELRGLRLEAGHACVEGPGSLPSWWSDFREASRVFQIEVYLGPAAGPAVRARTNALLDSLKIAPTHSS